MLEADGWTDRTQDYFILDRKVKCEIHKTDIRSLRILLKFIAVTPVSAFKELRIALSILHVHTHSQLEMEKGEGVFFAWRSALLLLFAPAHSSPVSEPCSVQVRRVGPWLTVYERPDSHAESDRLAGPSSQGLCLLLVDSSHHQD